MYVRDIMTKKVITIPGSTHLIEAKRLLQENGFRRLPVVDEGKLVGMVTSNDLEKVVPEGGVSSSMWDLSYNILTTYRTPVERIMHRQVVTVRPDMTVEEALALAQKKRVGSLVVVDNECKVVGIVTTNDFFYRIVNEVLGIGTPGCRIQVTGGGEGRAMEEIISAINRRNLKIVTVHIIAPAKAKKKDIVVHLDCQDIGDLVSELKGKGYEVDLRKR